MTPIPLGFRGKPRWLRSRPVRSFPWRRNTPHNGDSGGSDGGEGDGSAAPSAGTTTAEGGAGEGYKGDVSVGGCSASDSGDRGSGESVAGNTVVGGDNGEALQPVPPAGKSSPSGQE